MGFLSRKSKFTSTSVEEQQHPIVEELEEFARAVRDETEPEMDGEHATRSLAVVLAGIRSAKEGRRIEIAEVLR